MTDRLNLPLPYRRILEALLREQVPDAEVWAYGSRVIGESHDGSDLDLVVRGPELKPLGDGFFQLLEAIEKSNIPILLQAHDWARLPESFHAEIRREYVVLQEGSEPRTECEWSTTTWGELATLEYGKSLRGYDSAEGRYRVYGTNGPIGRHDKPLCPYASVIIGRKGAYRGVHYSPDPFFVIDTAFYVKPKVDLDTRWAYYQLLTQNINGLDSGSAIPSTSRNDFYGLPVDVPPLTEQRAIAHVLGTLDDKIELNRRMNETLEEMARALFKSWFVDFLPVRAKAALGTPSQGGSDWTVERAGAYLDSMDKDIVDLFPDRLVESELGKIPEGWEVKALGEVANQRRSGVSPEQIDPGSPYIGLEHMPQHCIALSEWGSADGLASGKFRFKQGDILFGKLRPYFHKVGVAPLDGLCSTDIVVVSPISTQLFGYVLGHSSSKEFVDYTDAASTGTRMPRTKWEDMAQYRVAVPGVVLAGSFSEIIVPWIKKILSAIHESHFLAQQRDTLLPQLISGQLRGGQ